VEQTVVVNRKGAERWRRGHPWIYRSDVASGAAEAGVVRVEDGRGAPLGMAFYSPPSLISVRMLTGDVRPIDLDFWRERLGAALAYRRTLAPDANAYRLVHGEADGIPSLIVDRYGDQLSVQLLSAGLETCRDEVVRVLVELLEPRGILARNDVAVRRYERLPQDVEVLHGEVPDRLEVREGRVRYLVDLAEGQKTGAFLDQRENRMLAARLSRGRALDCFAYHGSFALHLALGADEVIAVDSSAPALERARANAEMNGYAHVRTREANAFDFLRAAEAAGDLYDLVVVDPPAFAKDKRSVDAALRGYKELNLRAMRILAPGGHLLTFSCSHHVSEERFDAMLRDAAADAGRPLRRLGVLQQAPDHPILMQVPETLYLKGALIQAP